MITFSFRITISVYERHTVNKNKKRSSIIITVAILVTICIAAFFSGILPSILHKGQSPDESIYSSEKESFSRRESEPGTKATAEPLTSAETKDTEPATESRESLPDETDDALLREPVFKPGYAFIYDFPARHPLTTAKFRNILTILPLSAGGYWNTILQKRRKKPFLPVSVSP